MPAGTVNSVEKTQRLVKIKEFLEEGKTVNEIVKEVGMTKRAVERNIKVLEELSVADLTTEEIASKRMELYIELLEAASEARAQFDKYKDIVGAGVDAKRFFSAWIDTITARQKLYGLDSIKMDNLTQINVNQYSQPIDRVDSRVADKISKMLKDNHEQKVQYIHDS